MPQKSKNKEHKHVFFAECSQYTLKQDAIEDLLACASGKPPKGISIDYMTNTVSIVSRDKSIRDTIVLNSAPRIACREMMSIFLKLRSTNEHSKGNHTAKPCNDDPAHNETCDSSIADTPMTWEILQATEMGQQAMRRYLERKELTNEQIENGMRLIMVASFVNVIRDVNVNIRQTTNGYRIKNIDIINIIDGRVVLNVPSITKDRKIAHSKTSATYADLSRPIIIT